MGKEDQRFLSWIVASVSESMLPQLVGAETACKTWAKLMVLMLRGQSHKFMS